MIKYSLWCDDYCGYLCWYLTIDAKARAAFSGLLMMGICFPKTLKAAALNSLLPTTGKRKGFRPNPAC